MEQARYGDTVRVHYTGRFEDGTVFDSSVDRDPMSFTIGGGHIIPGFERAVIGMCPGDSKTERIDADDAYGARRDDMVLEVRRDRFPENLMPEVGQPLQIRQPDGHTAQAVVARVDEETVTLDANHPLAGIDLIFEIQLVAID